jgi:hypothetical protein
MALDTQSTNENFAILSISGPASPTTSKLIFFRPSQQERMKQPVDLHH